MIVFYKDENCSWLCSTILCCTTIRIGSRDCGTGTVPPQYSTAPCLQCGGFLCPLLQGKVMPDAEKCLIIHSNVHQLVHYPTTQIHFFLFVFYMQFGPRSVSNKATSVKFSCEGFSRFKNSRFRTIFISS